MKTKKLLLALPMVVLLAACNKNAAFEDIFAKARKMKVSDYTKAAVMEFSDYYEMTTEISHYHNQLENTGSGWLYTGEGTTTTDYYVTLGSLDKTKPFLKLGRMINEHDQVSEFVIDEDDNGNPSYVVRPTGANYLDDAKKVFDLQFDSIYSWNTSFFAGCTYFLVNKQSSYFMPQKVINKYTRDFGIFEDDVVPGTFSITLNPSQPEVKVKGVLYTIDVFDLHYLNYRLDSTTFTFNIMEQLSSTLMDLNRYTVTTSTVNYYEGELPIY